LTARSNKEVNAYAGSRCSDHGDDVVITAIPARFRGPSEKRVSGSRTGPEDLSSAILIHGILAKIPNRRHTIPRRFAKGPVPLPPMVRGARLRLEAVMSEDDETEA